MPQEQALFADQLVQLPCFEELEVQAEMEESVGEQQLHPECSPTVASSTFGSSTVSEITGSFASSSIAFVSVAEMPLTSGTSKSLASSFGTNAGAATSN